MSEYEERRQRDREESHRYQMDAMYEVWRAGGDTDRIDCDRVSNHRDNGDSYEAAACDELRRQRPKPQDEEQMEQQEQWPLESEA